MIIVIPSGSGKRLEGLGGIHFPLKFLETDHCNLYVTQSSEGHARESIPRTDEVGQGPDLPGMEASPWGLGLNSKLLRTKWQKRTGCRGGEWGGGGKEGRRRRLQGKFNIVSPLQGALLPSESESTFLALTLSYLDPALSSLPGTVNLAVCCSNGPCWGGPHQISDSQLSPPKERHPGRESFCQATKCPHVSRCLVYVCGCAQLGIQDPIVFCTPELAQGLVARVGHNSLRLNTFLLS